ncbi:MAG TPA: sulfite exporter TauE/SafE family protein [Candidatus Polarisedimenticolaceae bacterium]|nr:sulfite exporter TauE/SafE family protein [Candidatus Polarisedimenticolaceae bacterium]
MSSWWFPLLGVVIGLAASFTGLGGGFLVVPMLVLLGFTPQRAVGTSFAAIVLISVASLFGHARLGDVDWRAGALIGLGGIAGAQIGPRLLQHVPQATFQKIFALILVGLAIWMFRR